MLNTSSFKKIHPFDRQAMIHFSLGFFIFVGFLSATFLMSQAQNLQSRAMIPTGTVQVRTTLESGKNSFTVGQPDTVNLQLNTFDTQVIGVQLIYTVTSTSFPTLTPDQIVIPAESGFVELFKNVTPVFGGYLVQIAVRPAGSISPTLTFSNNAFVNIVKMSVTPSSPGAFNIVFDPQQSTSLTTNSTDVLKTVPSFAVSVDDQVTPTATVQPGTSPMPTSTLIPSPTKGSKGKGNNNPKPTRSR